MPRLMNHSVLTRTAEGVGWKEFTSGSVNGAGEGVPLESADSCCEI